MNLRESVKQFKVLSEDLCTLIEDEGVVVRPYDSPSLPYFQRLEDKQQDEVVRNLRDYLEIAKIVVTEHGSIRHSDLFLKKALEYFNYEVDPTVFNYVQDDILCEIYNANHTQIFRTLSFLEQATYTIEDFYCRQWIHLYDRVPDVTSKLFEAAEKLIVGGVIGTIEPEAPEHMLIEKASLTRVRTRMRFTSISLLIKNGVPAGVLSTCRSQVVES